MASTTSFPTTFFDALNAGDGDAAVDALKRAAFGADSKPSPKAQELIDAGEWDQEQKLSLVNIDSTHCFGRVANDQYRFCGKRKTQCGIAGHFKNMIEGLKPGWYISNIGKNSGVYTHPYLPESPVGPIKSRGAALLIDGETPLRLTKGQWRLVMDAWYAEQVQVLSDDDPSEKSRPRLPTLQPLTENLQVDTFFLQTANQATESELKADHMSVLSDYSETLDLREEIKSLRRRQQILEIQRQNETDDQLEKFRVWSKAMEEQLAEAKNQVRNLETVVQTQQNQIRVAMDLAREQQQQMQDFKTAVSGTVQTLVTQIREHPGQGSGMTEHQREVLDQLEQAVLMPQGDFAALRLRFTEFRDKFDSGGGITCHHITFNSKKQLLAWFEDKQQHIEYYLDGLAYLHAIRPAAVQIEEATKERERESKLNLGSSLRTAVETSFDTFVPSVLLGGKATSEQGGSVYGWLLSHLKKFEVWKPLAVEDGVANQIAEGITMVTDRITDIRGNLTEESSAVVLSTGLCADSALFCRELVRFITEQYEDLTQRTLYTPQQIWSMQMECLSTIIKELCAARTAVADSARKQPGYYLWGMLRAWMIQQRYLSNNFKNDPALTGIMVRRILLQGQDMALKTKLEEITTIKQKVDENHRKAEEQHRTVMGEVKKLKEAVPKR
jgi:hypothetical protein